MTRGRNRETREGTSPLLSDSRHCDYDSLELRGVRRKCKFLANGKITREKKEQKNNNGPIH